MAERKYKILFLSDDFPPETNAAATRVYERALIWNKLGHKVEFITNFPNKFKGKKHAGYSGRLYQVDTIEGIKVVRIKTYITTSQKVFFRALDQISYMLTSFVSGLFVSKPDVIIATTPQFFCGISGFALSAVRNVPFVLEVADIWTDSVIGTGAASGNIFKLMRAVENYVYRRSRAIIVLTNAFREELINRGINKDKIFVARNGVNKDAFRNTGKNIDILNRYNLKNKKVVGYIGSMGSAQGLSNVIEAARISYERNGDDIAFMLVGEGAEKEELQRLSVGLSNVIFIPGQPKEKVSVYLSLCDVGLVHLKDHEVFKKNIPSKMFEMMAVGLPLLLVSPKGEAAEIIEENNVGKWVQSGNPALLSNAVLEMVREKDGLQKYSNSCLVAIDQFTRKKQARKVLDAVGMILDQAQGPQTSHL
jgi:glycosyltransferase involved in cell wall biosynthesis